jgi:hypothetical protein
VTGSDGQRNGDDGLRYIPALPGLDIQKLISCNVALKVIKEFTSNSPILPEAIEFVDQSILMEISSRTASIPSPTLKY